MRRINAPFNDCHLIRFDIAVHNLLRPSGVWVAFNPLDSSHDQPAHPGRVAGCYKPEASGAACASQRARAASAQESISLEPGKPVERELSGGQSHFYKIAMTSGQYLQITVSQRGIDALVALFTPDGKKIGEVDGEQMTVGQRLSRRSQRRQAHTESKCVPLRRWPKQDATRSR